MNKIHFITFSLILTLVLVSVFVLAQQQSGGSEILPENIGQYASVLGLDTCIKAKSSGIQLPTDCVAVVTNEAGENVLQIYNPDGDVSVEFVGSIESELLEGVEYSPQGQVVLGNGIVLGDKLKRNIFNIKLGAVDKTKFVSNEDGSFEVSEGAIDLTKYQGDDLKLTISEGVAATIGENTLKAMGHSEISSKSYEATTDFSGEGLQSFVVSNPNGIMVNNKRSIIYNKDGTVTDYPETLFKGQIRLFASKDGVANKNAETYVALLPDASAYTKKVTSVSSDGQQYSNFAVFSNSEEKGEVAYALISGCNEKGELSIDSIACITGTKDGGFSVMGGGVNIAHYGRLPNSLISVTPGEGSKPIVVDSYKETSPLFSTNPGFRGIKMGSVTFYSDGRVESVGDISRLSDYEGTTDSGTFLLQGNGVGGYSSSTSSSGIVSNPSVQGFTVGGLGNSGVSIEGLYDGSSANSGSIIPQVNSAIVTNLGDRVSPSLEGFNYEGTGNLLSMLILGDRQRLLNLQRQYGLKFVEGDSRSGNLMVYDKQGKKIGEVDFMDLGRIKAGGELLNQINSYVGTVTR